MSKFVKELLQGQYEKVLESESVESFLVLRTKGISGNENNELRGQLKDKGIRMMVTRNALFRKALQAKGMEAAGELFDGPCTIAFGGDSIVDVAKEITDWAKKLKPIEVKGAFVEGQSLDEKGAVELSKMPNRQELQGQIVGLAMSPARQVAGCICSPAGIVAGCIKAIADKADKEAA